MGFTDGEALIETYRRFVADVMQNKFQARQPMWTESIAVGDEEFVSDTKRKLSSMATGRKIIPKNGVYELREPTFPYGPHFNSKNKSLRLENELLWNINHNISDT